MNAKICTLLNLDLRCKANQNFCSWLST